MTGALAACGDDTDTSAGGGGADGGGGSPETGGGGSTGETIECGDELTCDGGTVCIIEPNEPDCQNLKNPDDPCPKGTTMTNCGGAGIPCCCGPTPDPDYRCASSEACDGELTCECVAPCTDGDWCSELASPRTLQCEPPPEA